MVQGRCQLRRIRKRLEIGRCPLYNGEEDMIHIFLNDQKKED
jgi:hypothetical protein